MGKPEGKRAQRELDVVGRLIMKWILEKWDGVIWTGFIWLRNQSLALVKTAMKLRVALNFGRFFSSSTFGDFSRTTQLYKVSWLASKAGLCPVRAKIKF
jgi:hypothetical protein